jgi:uncharacterized membrane protein
MEYKHNPSTLSEIKETRKPIRKLTRKEIKVDFTPLEKFALFITRKVGSLGFFFVLSVWTFGWLIWNVTAPINLRFDPAPAFVVWLFTSNVIQMILLPLVMVGQNLEGKFADQRAQADFEVNQKAEKEIETILSHLENQNELLLQITRHIDKR